MKALSERTINEPKFDALLSALIIVFTISYFYLSVVSSVDATLSFTIILWLINITLISLTLVYGHGKLPRILVIALTPVMFSWLQYLWYMISVNANFITHIRFEAYIDAFYRSGHIVMLEPHGSLFNNYLMPHVLITILGIKGRWSLVTIHMILGCSMIILLAILLCKTLEPRNLLSSVILLLLLSMNAVYVGGLEVSAIDIFVIGILALYIHHTIKTDCADAKHIVPITILAFAVSTESLSATIIVLGILLVSIIIVILTGRSKSMLVLITAIVSIFSKMSLDYLHLKYMQEYGNYLEWFMNHLCELISGQVWFLREPLGTVHIETTFSFFNYILSFIKIISFISYIVLIIYSVLNASRIVISKRYLPENLVPKAIAIIFMVMLVFAIGGYFAQLVMTRIGDVYGLLHVKFIGILLPLVMAFYSIVSKDESIRYQRLFMAFFAISIIMAPLMLSYMYSDAPGRLTVYEAKIDYGYHIDFSEVVNFIFEFNVVKDIYVNTPMMKALLSISLENPLYFRATYTSGFPSLRLDLNSMIYQSKSYTIFYILEEVERLSLIHI